MIILTKYPLVSGRLNISFSILNLKLYSKYYTLGLQSGTRFKVLYLFWLLWFHWCHLLGLHPALGEAFSSPSSQDKLSSSLCYQVTLFLMSFLHLISFYCVLFEIVVNASDLAWVPQAWGLWLVIYMYTGMIFSLSLILFLMEKGILQQRLFKFVHRMIFISQVEVWRCSLLKFNYCCPKVELEGILTTSVIDNSLKVTLGSLREWSGVETEKKRKKGARSI